jgi:hypothetical protein
MTGGARPSAGAGGGRAAGPRWAANEAGWERKRCEGDRATKGEGLPPDFGGWAAQKQGRKEEKFSIFETKIQTRFKHKFESNQPKINAPTCMQQ